MLKKQPVEIKDLVYFRILGMSSDMFGIVTYINPFVEKDNNVSLMTRGRIVVANQETEATFTYNVITEELLLSGIFVGKWHSQAIVTDVLKS